MGIRNKFEIVQDFFCFLQPLTLFHTFFFVRSADLFNTFFIVLSNWQFLILHFILFIGCWPFLTQHGLNFLKMQWRLRTNGIGMKVVSIGQVLRGITLNKGLLYSLRLQELLLDLAWLPMLKSGLVNKTLFRIDCFFTIVILNRFVADLRWGRACLHDLVLCSRAGSIKVLLRLLLSPVQVYRLYTCTQMSWFCVPGVPCAHVRETNYLFTV